MLASVGSARGRLVDGRGPGRVRLGLAAHTDDGPRPRRLRGPTARRRPDLLAAGQHRGNVPVRAQRIPREFPGLHFSAFTFAEGDKRPAVKPKCALILIIFVEEFLQRFGIAALHQARGKHITDALVVVRVQPQHVAIMADRGIYLTKGIEGRGQPSSSAHVGSGFEEAPKMTRIFCEAPRSQCQSDTKMCRPI